MEIRKKRLWARSLKRSLKSLKTHELAKRKVKRMASKIKTSGTLEREGRTLEGQTAVYYLVDGKRYRKTQ